MTDCAKILDTAKGLITGDRNKVYGTARDDFTRIGKLWEQVLGVPVSPEQVALCMNQVKVSRLTNSPSHEDSWVDMCGYAALGGEIATTDEWPADYTHLPKSDDGGMWQNRLLFFRHRDGHWEANSRMNDPAHESGWVDYPYPFDNGPYTRVP